MTIPQPSGRNGDPLTTGPSAKSTERDWVKPVSIICQGPTGVGYFCEVTDLPSLDRGVTANGHGALLVCDAAIVAFMAAREFPGQVHLVTNNLGSVEHESRLIRTKLGTAVNVYPDPLPFIGTPMDMIFIDRPRGMRSFVTTNYFPSSAHLSTTTQEIYTSLAPKSRTVLYADIEVESEGGLAAKDASTSLEFSGASVWNVGQVGRLSEVEEWLSSSELPENAIIQASLGTSSVTARELQNTWRRVSSATGQSLLVTLGGNGAAWADERHVERVEVGSVLGPFTLGAGAVLASSLVRALAREDSPGLRNIFSSAVAAATEYVDHATTSGNLSGLDYW